jgi:hypothetical protein
METKVNFLMSDLLDPAKSERKSEATEAVSCAVETWDNKRRRGLVS